MSSLKALKPGAGVALLAAASMLMVGPAVASSKDRADDPDCRITVQSRQLRVERAAMERQLVAFRADKVHIERKIRHFSAVEPQGASHPIARGVNKIAALAKLPGQGVMVAHKMLTTFAKVLPGSLGAEQ